jgi:hypothetical protein
MVVVTPSASAEARRRLSSLTRRSRRRSVQFPEGFLRDPNGDPPMARIFRGDRAGELRLKLYVTGTMLAAAAPHDIKGISGRGWAEVLGLEDPATSGARRINAAIDWLAEHDFVTIEQAAGHAPTITLLDPGGSDRPYRRPRKRWVSVPIGLWSRYWIYELDGPSLAVLLAVLDMQGVRTPRNAPWLSGSERPRYGLSDDTWTRGTKRLQQLDLLTVKRVPQGRDFDYRRLRNTYWIDLDRFDDKPEDDPEADE